MGRRGGALVFINGSILGVHRRPAHFADTLRALRRRGCIGPYVSVFLQQDCCYVACDGGRVCRPLLICENGLPLATTEHMKVQLLYSKPKFVYIQYIQKSCLRLFRW